MMTNYAKCFLKTLVPVHIGCGEVYEPMGFVVDQQKSQLVVFDPVEFLGQMPKSDRERFSQICRKGTVSSILELYTFLKGRRAQGREIDVCTGFLDHYRKTLGLPGRNEPRIQQELNQFQIARTAFGAVDERPYIPGSSLKGAMRTAYLNAMQAKKKTPGRRYEPKDYGQLEKDLLEYRDIESDPFRMVKVSDFMPVGDVRTRIVYAVNRPKGDPTKLGRGLSTLVEVIPKGTVFLGSVSLEKPERGSPIRSHILWGDLWPSISGFFTKEQERENRELAALGIKSPAVNSENGGRLLRIGRHSGAECVTIEGHRQISIRRGRGRESVVGDGATTLWLASEHPRPSEISSLQPMGWAVLGILDSAEEHRLARIEQEWINRARAIAVARQGRDVSQPTGAPAQTRPKTEPLPQPEAATELWGKAVLDWNRGNATLTAEVPGKTAKASGLELVPDSLKARLTGKKKKEVYARVRVEVVGPRYFRIVRVEEES